MDNLNNNEYRKYADKKVPKPTYVKNMILAFLVGGGICTIGQFVNNYLDSLGYSEELSGMGTSIFMVFLGALLTGIGVYDKIGKVGGAGAAVPITGFANSIVAPAMEFKREAGPVIVYGVGSSIIVGLLSILFKG